MQAKMIAERLAENAAGVAGYLFPQGSRSGHNWQVGNTQGDNGKSLSICLEGQNRGLFSDFATGEAGDLLTLWSLNRKISITEAITEATRYLGIPEALKRSPRSDLKVIKQPENIKPLVATSRVMQYLKTERKLTPETLAAFKISERGDEIVFPYYHDGQLLNIKYLKIDRPNGKKQITSEKNAQPCLFGWQALDANADTVTICEGELDAVSLYQYGINALSVPYGAGLGAKFNWLELEYERLQRFKTIYLYFDQDEVGQQTAEELSKRLGRHKCPKVSGFYKDANECLQHGVTTEEMQEFFSKAKTVDPAELKSPLVFTQSVINKFYPPEGAVLGARAGWQKADGKVLFRPAELSVWTGTNGHGKSQFLGQICLATMQQGFRVCIASLELKPELLLKRLVQQAAGLDNPTPEYIQAILDWFEGKLWIFDLTGTAKTARLMEVFLYARQRYGIDFFVIDSFMKCGVSEEDYSSQKKFVEELCDFKNEHNCHIHLIVHPRKGMDETRPPGKLDVKGTGSVTDLADNCFTIWRNKKKEDDLIKLQAKGEDTSEVLKQPDCMWICDKQRNGDWEGKLYFWFDKRSYQFLEGATHKAVQYVPFSKTPQQK